MAGPDVHHVLALDRRGEARPDVAALREVALELFAQRGEPRVAVTVDFHALPLFS